MDTSSASPWPHPPPSGGRHLKGTRDSAMKHTTSNRCDLPASELRLHADAWPAVTAAAAIAPAHSADLVSGRTFQAGYPVFAGLQNPEATDDLSIALEVPLD